MAPHGVQTRWSVRSRAGGVVVRTEGLDEAANCLQGEELVPDRVDADGTTRCGPCGGQRGGHGADRNRNTSRFVLKQHEPVRARCGRRRRPHKNRSARS